MFFCLSGDRLFALLVRITFASRRLGGDLCIFVTLPELLEATTENSATDRFFSFPISQKFWGFPDLLAHMLQTTVGLYYY
jgi:hypothetical protein